MRLGNNSLLGGDYGIGMAVLHISGKASGKMGVKTLRSSVSRLSKYIVCFFYTGW